MERETGLLVRPDFRDIVVKEGLGYVDTITPDSHIVSYWREGTAYTFTKVEVDYIEQATRRLFQMFIAAGDYVIKNNLFAKLGIPEFAIPAIKELWKDVDDPVDPARPGWYTPMLYGRFDLAPILDSVGKITGIKLLEYNADTPTGLVESAITQWNWAMDAGFIGDGKPTGQWNTLFESLVAGWVYEIRKFREITGRRIDTVHFACSCQEQSGEDALNTGFMMEAARAASKQLRRESDEGFEVKALYMCQIFRTGDADEHSHPVGEQFFSDPDHEHIEMIFKLYPWEWIFQQEFARSAVDNMLMLDGTVWIEPIWKAMWSNKGILAILWELFKDTSDAEFLLPAYFEGEEPPGFREDYVRKPLHGREGGCAQVFVNGQLTEEGPASYEGDSGKGGPFVLQELCPLPEFRDGSDLDQIWHTVIGVYTTEDAPVGLMVRESTGLITNNLSFFVPQIVTELLNQDKEEVEP